jgi:hypothetical protein
MKDEIQLVPLMSRPGVAPACVVPDTADCSAVRSTAMSAMRSQRYTGTPELPGGGLGISVSAV